jgi:predicted MPP superfamily phosphohydrolase
MIAGIREVVTLERVASATLFVAAGLCSFLYLLNRLPLQLRSGKPKVCFVVLAFLALTVVPAFFGYLTGLSPWLLAPVVFLLAALSGEVRRAVIRRRCRGSPPVETRNGGVSLKRPFTTRDLRVLRYEVQCSNWRGRAFRVALIGDLHINDSFPKEYYAKVMSHVAASKPDLLFIAGDFVSRGACARSMPDVFAGATGRLGTFAVLGNHDYWHDPDEVSQMVRRTGVKLLGNECRRVFVEDGKDLLICGCEDPWGEEAWQAPTASSGELVLVLTHTADNIYRLSEASVTAVFAGHYHAGQIRIPLLGPLVMPSVYGRRFDHGHFVVDGTHLFVTAGIGTTMLPLRIYCRPDIFVVDFHGQR